jgi:hypothetical protein
LACCHENWFKKVQNAETFLRPNLCSTTHPRLNPTGRIGLTLEDIFQHIAKRYPVTIRNLDQQFVSFCRYRDASEVGPVRSHPPLANGRPHPLPVSVIQVLLDPLGKLLSILDLEESIPRPFVHVDRVPPKPIAQVRSGMVVVFIINHFQILAPYRTQTGQP